MYGLQFLIPRTHMTHIARYGVSGLCFDGWDPYQCEDIVQEFDEKRKDT